MAHFKITKTVTISILSSFLVVSSSFAETEFKFPEIRLNNRETPVKKVNPVTKKNSTKNKETNTVKEKPKEDVLDVNYYYKKGRDYYTKHTTKSYREAIKQYDLGLKLDKNNALLRASKSEALSLLSRDLNEASTSIEGVNLEMQAFENAYIAVDIDPELADAHRALSMVYLIKENFKEGRKSASKAISINEEDSESHLLLWLNSPDRDKMTQASIYSNYYKSLDINSKSLERSLELDDKNPLTYLELGEVYSAQSKFNKALEYYDKVLEISPENIKANNLSGFVYIELSELENAFKSFDDVLELDENNSEATYGLGIAYLKNRDNLKALEYITKSCNEDYADACDMKNNLELRRWQNRPWNRTRRRNGTPTFNNLSN